MEEEERIIWSLPLLHNAAQVCVLIPVVAMGVSAVLMPRVDVPHMLTLIERHRVTRAMSIGPIARRSWPMTAWPTMISVRCGCSSP